MNIFGYPTKLLFSCSSRDYTCVYMPFRQHLIQLSLNNELSILAITANNGYLSNLAILDLIELQFSHRHIN